MVVMVAMMILLSNEDEKWRTDEDEEEDIEMTYETIVVSKVNDCCISDVSCLRLYRDSV